MTKIGFILFAAAFSFAAWALGPSYIALTTSAVVAAIAFALAAAFFNADRLEARKSRARTPDIETALRGRAKTRDDWMPDARVQAGMIFNRKQRRIEIGGRLSDDTLRRVFR